MRHLMRLFVPLSFVVSSLHAQPCSTFDDRTLDGWSGTNATAVVKTAGGATYADVVDGPGASNFLAPASYHGNWFVLSGGCGQLCFDVNVIDDGFAGAGTTVRPYLLIADAAGHSATFAANSVAKDSGWHHFCAPVAPLTNGQLPVGADGTWSYGANTTADNWGALLHDVQTFWFAVDVGGSSAVSEHLLFDNICFRPKSCAAPPPETRPAVVESPSAIYVGAVNDCPRGCTTVTKHQGDVYYTCTWDEIGPRTAPFVDYVPGTFDNANCTAGVPLDVEPRHRLFVHGLHSNGQAWGYWIDRVKPQMDYLGMHTVADDTGKTGRYGDGSAPLITQVLELAAQINAGFPNVPDGSVETYAHSLGALKMEALLQLGFDAQPGNVLYDAARKIGTVKIFQGAHGGCAATAFNGDSPNHADGLPPWGCPASKDIGRVSDGSLSFDMNKVVWRGRGAQEKHFIYVTATANGGDVCQGAQGFICHDDQDHDGVVYKWQMVPSWFPNFADAANAGLVKVIPDPGHYCHMIDDVYDPPRRSAELYDRYVGKKPGPFRYLVMGTKTKYTIDRDVTTCDSRCFCEKDPGGACKNRLDCSRFGGWNCALPDPGQTSGGTGPAWFPVHAPEPLSSWTHCAAEGGTCTFRGIRRVRFGARGTYAIHTATGGTSCTAAVFGDPLPGVAKSCDMEVPAPQLSPVVLPN
jgi:hypothetical protein